MTKAKKREKIYISGPISGRPLGVAISHFRLAEAKLQAQGYRTCNPLKMRLCVWLAMHGHKRLCLALQLLWMWWTCSCIYLLTDWHTSDGARLERSFARCLGLTALYEQKAASKREMRDTCISDSEREQARPQVKRKPLGNVPAPTHVLTPEKKTSKKQKKKD